MSENHKDMVWRANLLLIMMIAVGIYIIGVMFNLIFFKGDQWRNRTENQTARTNFVEAKRGDIYSVDSSLMVMTMSIYEVRMDLHESVIPQDTFNLYVRALSDSLHRMFPKNSSAYYLKRFKQARNYKLEANPRTGKSRGKGQRSLLIARNIKYDDLKRIKSFPLLCKGPNKGGLVVSEKNRRVILHKHLASRTIGYYKDSLVAVGLEAAYNLILAGSPGIRVERKIANGVWRPVFNEGKEPQNGRDIVTTIDMKIQDVAEAALRRCLEANDADQGTAVLMEVATGEIRAIANLKKARDSQYYELENHAVNDLVEPGSTFKLASIIAVLEEGILDTSDIVPTGTMNIADKILKDSKPEGWGNVSLKRAFEVSSNVGIAYAVRQSFEKNPKKFTDYLYDMRLNQPLGIEIPGERRPFIKNPVDHKKQWWKTSLSWMSMGYEVQMTPLQQIAFYNAIANNGVMVKPMFVKEIREGGETIEFIRPTVLHKQICSPKTLAKVKSLLESAVKNGTGARLSKSPYPVAGKTGTAQTNYAQKGTQKLQYRASFIGYFPANKPLYTCLVIVSNPQRNQRYGGEVAAPVFKEIADKVFATHSNLYQSIADTAQYEPCTGRVVNRNTLKQLYAFLGFEEQVIDGKTPYVRSVLLDNKANYQAVHQGENVVPNVIGMSIREAVFVLESKGLYVRFSGYGQVKQQSIPAGSNLDNGATVWLTLK